MTTFLLTAVYILAGLSGICCALVLLCAWLAWRRSAAIIDADFTEAPRTDLARGRNVDIVT